MLKWEIFQTICGISNNSRLSNYLSFHYSLILPRKEVTAMMVSALNSSRNKQSMSEVVRYCTLHHSIKNIIKSTNTQKTKRSSQAQRRDEFQDDCRYRMSVGRMDQTSATKKRSIDSRDPQKLTEDTLRELAHKVTSRAGHTFQICQRPYSQLFL